MKYKVAGTIALLSALAIGTLDAQQRGTRPTRPGAAAPDSQGHRQRAGRPENVGHPAAVLLRMRQQLNLTEAQVARLETLRKSPLTQVSESARLRAQADLVDAMRGDGNPEAARAALERMHKLQIDRQVAQIRARKEAREILTAEQKSQVDQLQRRLVDNRRDRVGPNGRGQVRGARPGAQGFGPGAGVRRPNGPKVRRGPQPAQPPHRQVEPRRVPGAQGQLLPRKRGE
jgi:Spy/CpxP family protein refolding chaperone